MIRISRSGLAAVGAFALTTSVVGDSSALLPPARPKATTQTVRPTRPVAGQVARPGVRPTRPVAGQTASTKIRFRDRGSFNTPVAGSAWQQLGFGQRFLRTGDTWTMAWSSLTRPEIMKRGLSPRLRTPSWGPAVYVAYQVRGVRQEKIGNRTRTLATIRMTYGRKPVVAASTFAEVTIDQFWNPVSFRLYSQDLPYGKRMDKDTRRVLHGVGEFPLYVGDLEMTRGYQVRLPRVLPQLAMHRPLSGNVIVTKVANGKNVHAQTYWTPGFPYATYVISQHHQGILVSQQRAR